MLDADVIIHAEKGKFNLQEWVAARSDDQLAVAAITVAELWHGVERATGKQRQVRRHFLQAALKRLPVFPYSERTAYLHATLWAHLQEKGAMI